MGQITWGLLASAIPSLRSRGFHPDDFTRLLGLELLTLVRIVVPPHAKGWARESCVYVSVPLLPYPHFSPELVIGDVAERFLGPKLGTNDERRALLPLADPMSLPRLGVLALDSEDF